MTDIAKLVSDYREYIEREGFIDALDWIRECRPATWGELMQMHTFALWDFWRDWGQQARFLDSVVGRVLV